jgi:PPOX class probable F420-dependent enzyme
METALQPAAIRTFDHQPTVSLTTFKRDGTAVATPVNFAVDGDRAYFRTWTTSGKAKRLRRDGRVLIAPCTFRGRVTGAGVPAEARRIEGAVAERARHLIERKHPILQGVLVRYAHRLTGRHTVYYEVTTA